MRFLRWSILLLSLGLAAVTLWLFRLNWQTVVPATWGVGAGTRNSPLALANAALFAALSIWPTYLMGALILQRHPRHRLGWLLLAAGFSNVLDAIAAELTIYFNFTRPGLGWPANISAWILNFVWIFNIVLYVGLVSLFPNGRLPSPRWRWVHWLILSFVVLVGFDLMIETPMHSAYGLANPLLIDFPGRQELYGALYALALAILAAAVIGLVVLVVVRFRRSRGDERQQFKWVAFSATLGGVVIIAGILLLGGRAAVFGQALIDDGLAGLPLGIGIAVLRYRLYDVDLLIRRTLVYSLVTALLALIYFGGVLGLQILLVRLTGQARSQLVTVLTTLVIAALFFPLRQRVQAFIDRRFYRQRYDAAKILSNFAATARAETDLDALSAQLVEVVNAAMQCESVGLWLKPGWHE